MEKNIAACGNDCGACPRHLPKTEAELNRTAELWMKIGYRDRIVSSEEISCTGCSPEEYDRMVKAFFEKKKNLDQSARERRD